VRGTPGVPQVRVSSTRRLRCRRKALGPAALRALDRRARLRARQAPTTVVRPSSRSRSDSPLVRNPRCVSIPMARFASASPATLVGVGSALSRRFLSGAQRCLRQKASAVYGLESAASTVTAIQRPIAHRAPHVATVAGASMPRSARRIRTKPGVPLSSRVKRAETTRAFRTR
jgi:hypothetical protein